MLIPSLDFSTFRQPLKGKFMSFHMSLRRKVAIASWASPREGNIYGKMTVDMKNALDYIEHLRKTSGQKITITHLIGKAAGVALADCPDINGRIFLGRYIPHKTVDISFLVTLDGGKDLAKLKICDMDKKTIVEIAHELTEGAERLRQGKDKNFEKPKGMIRVLPTWIIRPMLWLTGYLTGAMGVNIKFLGLEKFPFGAAIITSIGMFGLDEGYAPPTPFARVPVYLTIPEVKKRPVVINDQVVIRPMLDITATIDHRFLDGYRGAMLAKVIKKLIENPWVMDGLESLPELHSMNHIDHKTSICDKQGANVTRHSPHRENTIDA
jgi:pyruvate/2-oxoglutarate dehydrogenase complex dihydrolipoamide acyltransferase (E2) component